MTQHLQITPYKYQEDSRGRVVFFDGVALLAHEMGLGKTIIVLLYFQKEEPEEVFPALIVCPASAKINWQRESERILGFCPAILEGKKPKKRGLVGSPKAVIVNYDILASWQPYLVDCEFNTIVFDECHYLQNRKTLRTKAAVVLSRGISKRLALSGTPLTNRPSELWSTLNILKPKEYPSFGPFAQRYCKPKYTRWGWDYSGAANLEELHAKMTRSCMIRYRKADVLDDLPEKVRRVIPLELSNFEEYAQIRDNFVGWLKENCPQRINRAIRAIALTRVGDLLRVAARLKLRQVVDWANQFLEETDEKLVLFGIHRKCIEALERRIKSKSIVLDGSVSPKLRQVRVDQFQTDPETRVCIGNIQAAGTVYTLTEASTVGMVELWWRPGDLLQAEDRIHRIGQKKKSWINYFVAAGTIEEKVCEILQQKQENLIACLDGREITEEDLTIFDQLIAELRMGKTLGLPA